MYILTCAYAHFKLQLQCHTKIELLKGFSKLLVACPAVAELGKGKKEGTLV